MSRPTQPGGIRYVRSSLHLSGNKSSNAGAAHRIAAGKENNLRFAKRDHVAVIGLLHRTRATVLRIGGAFASVKH